MRNVQYHEIDKIEQRGSLIAARIVNRIRGKVLQAFKEGKFLNINLNELILPTIAASILSDLKGRNRSFLSAHKSFDHAEAQLTLGYQEEKKKYYQKKSKIKREVKRVIKLPIRKAVKKAVNVGVEGAGAQELKRKFEQGKKIYKGGKKLKRKIAQTPIQYIGEKSRIKPVPSHFVKHKKKRFREVIDKETARVKLEIKQKVKKERKYIYDETVRHLRVILRDVAKIGLRTVNWQEVLNRLTNQERNVNDIQSLVRQEVFDKESNKLVQKIINKVKRKIRDKKDRAKLEIKSKAVKEVARDVHEIVAKPVKKSLKERIHRKVFGEPRKAGSHRQYRGTYYHLTKALQELERGQRHRRQYETSQRILGALGGIADLVGFLSRYSIQDVFVFLTELGGETYFPETYKIGGVIKAANYVNETARTLEKYETFRPITEKISYQNVKEYQVKRTLQLIQELQTIKKLFSRYYPPVFKILENASTKVNDNLRQVVNDSILSGATVKEGTKALNRAFYNNGLIPKNPFQLETIYRTQSALAFSAGRFQADQHPAIQEILWGYKYVTVGDTRVRPAHRVLDGVTLPKDSEFWFYFWPPNGWNCRCQVISLFEPRKLVYPPDDWKGLAEIDQNFSFNPGHVFTEAPQHLVGTRG